MIRIRLVWVGRTREPWLREGLEEYLRRLRPFARCEVVEVREERSGEAARRREKEGGRILSALAPSVYTMALDERGDALSTRRFAEWLGRRESAGERGAAFVLGGPEGLDPAVLGRAERLLSLSPMTLTHEMARLVLVEQLYRAFTILRGHPYHRD